MKELLEFILKNILGESVKFEVIEEIDGDVIKYSINVTDDNAGLVIGKGGKIINSIRNLLRVKAVILKKKVILQVN